MGWRAARVRPVAAQWSAHIREWTELPSGSTGMHITIHAFIHNCNAFVNLCMQNVCMPEVRGTAFAIFTLTDDIGKGLGPGEFLNRCVNYK